MYRPIIPILEKGIKESGTEQIIDLDSGGGGGWLWLNAELHKSIPGLKILLTDYFPNIAAFEHTKSLSDNFEYVSKPIDARDVSKELKGLRTQFLSFHHFRPDDATRILQNAVDREQPIAIFEAQERSIPSLVAMLFSPITLLLTTPFIRPFWFGMIIFTYLIPIIPLFVLWDGIVSSLRTYSEKEMNELVKGLKNTDRFNWEIGKIKSGLGVIFYLLGTVKNKQL